MSKTGLLFVVGLSAILAWTVPQAAQTRPAWREILAPVTDDLSGLQEQLLKSPFPEPDPGRQFVLLPIHLNPSAERLMVFSRDGTLVRELLGWEVAALPRDVIVYHNNQVHFARGKPLEMSVFDPAANVDRRIYPPAAPGEIRRAFVARVAAAYNALGEDWFRINNHPMDPERFDSGLQAPVAVDERGNSMTFRVRFGGDEPLTFSEAVQVTCAPLTPIADMTCRETAIR